MRTNVLLYGATGYVGEAAARFAVQSGLRPLLGGRDAAVLARLAGELGVEYRSFGLDDAALLDSALAEVSVVLHCAGPYIHTYKQMVEGCLRTGTHYLDLTGEFPVYEAIAARDAAAKERGIMLMPGVGFDVVPTDCLALHLKQRLPSATHLALAFRSKGPGGLPPGTQRTVIEMLSYGNRVRRGGRLERSDGPMKTRRVDFGQGPVDVTQMMWGDVFTAYYSTGIPNVEDYTVLPRAFRKQMRVLNALRPLFRIAMLRNLLKRAVKPGPTPAARAQTVTHVWGEVTDDEGRRAVARLHGPEAGVEWTMRTALAVVRRVLAGDAPRGYQTPAMAYGADLVLECDGVTREDVEGSHA
ncbi:MAG: saccharopine dehydrogenase NADP-binding domain-containing protein [Gemmatimonas sp.]